MSNSVTLDPALNIVPDTLRCIHIIGVCGTGMAALAGMLKQQGYVVTGSDQNVYPPMSDFLAESGIEVMEGYHAENLASSPDLVVVGNVVRAVNPEALALGELKIPYISMPQALGYFFLADRKPLVVAGTHGKTTTSSILATTMHRIGCTPGFMIGGIVEAFDRNFNISDTPYFVVEGDEYDTAFFNKVSKFHHYQPFGAIITSVEFDHADIFPTIEVIKESFAAFIKIIPEQGVLVANFDDPLVEELCQNARCKVISYGTAGNRNWLLEQVRIAGTLSHFSLVKEGDHFADCTLPMPGVHNAMNATAVVALLDHLGFVTTDITQGLASFEGVKRRQQIRGQENGVTVIDDFAHHPTAVRETIKALRQAWEKHRLIIVFEPRTNTSRRALFQADYANAFQGADMVIVREHVPLEDVPLEEQFSSSQLVTELQTKGIMARYFPKTEAILEYLLENKRAGDVVAVLSNGGFDNIHDRLLEQLKRVVV